MAFTTLISRSITPFPAAATAPVLVSPKAQFAQPSATPEWLIGLALSWLAFGTVFAVILVMAQFPSLFPWPARVARQRTTALPSEMKKKEREGRARGLSSAVARTAEVDGGGFRMRKPRGLGVDTHPRDTGKGLGILLPEREEGRSRQKKVKKQVSFDVSVIRQRPRSKGKEAATAPLPQSKSFLQTLNPDDGSGDDDDDRFSCADIDSGFATPDTQDLNDNYADPRASPYFKGSHGIAAHEDEETETKGWLGKVNQGVYHVADTLSATFYDKVNGPEEGLLLPVREHEREGWMGRAVD